MKIPPYLTASLAFLWLWSGLQPVLTAPDASLQLLADIGIAVPWRRPIFYAASAWDVLLGILILTPLRRLPALWLLLALLVGRPSRPEWAAFTVTQVIYWAAIWGYLAGHLNSNPNIYFAAIILRIVVEVWIFISCLCDAADPGHDPLRTPQVADPIGGVLNEAAGPFARLRSTQPGNRAEMGQFPA